MMNEDVYGRMGTCKLPDTGRLNSFRPEVPQDEIYTRWQGGCFAPLFIPNGSGVGSSLSAPDLFITTGAVLSSFSEPSLYGGTAGYRGYVSLRDSRKE